MSMVYKRRSHLPVTNAPEYTPPGGGVVQNFPLIEETLIIYYGEITMLRVVTLLSS